MAQITRATVEEGSDVEANEQAYAELVEYLRVATQLAFEELADLREGEVTDQEQAGDDPEVIH